MDASDHIQSTKSKSEAERQIPDDTTYMWTLKCGRNKPVYRTDLQTENRLVSPRGGAGSPSAMLLSSVWCVSPGSLAKEVMTMTGLCSGRPTS